MGIDILLAYDDASNSCRTKMSQIHAYDCGRIAKYF